MHGLVNEALRDLVIASRGKDAWAEVAAAVGIQTSAFVSMCPYDDRLTFALVTAVSAVMGVTEETVFERFGEHWITVTAARDYGALLAICGRTFPAFLEQLEMIHSRMKLAFPALEPPMIACIQLAPGLVRVDYTSHRRGLAPMVVGLIRGLAKKFDTPVQIEQIAERDIDGTDRFLVSFEEAA